MSVSATYAARDSSVLSTSEQVDLSSADLRAEPGSLLVGTWLEPLLPLAVAVAAGEELRVLRAEVGDECFTWRRTVACL